MAFFTEDNPKEICLNITALDEKFLFEILHYNATVDLALTVKEGCKLFHFLLIVQIIWCNFLL